MKRLSRFHVVQGNILPLALVMMTAILLAGIGLGTVVLDGLRRTADADASTVSYYSADAGIERQLYDLRKLSSSIVALGTLDETFSSNGAKWDAASSGFLQTTSKSFPAVKQGDFQFVDLFNPDAVNVAAGVGRVDWSWGKGADCGALTPEMEMSYAQWLAGSDVLPQEFVVTPPGLMSPQTFYLDPSKGYRLRFRPKGCSAADLKVEVSPTAAYVPMAFPGDITLGSTGSYRKTSQSISVQAPRQEILSGVFSYVIFSECELFKDPTNPSPPTCP
jgi:hypothetical protein